MIIVPRMYEKQFSRLLTYLCKLNRLITDVQLFFLIIAHRIDTKSGIDKRRFTTAAGLGDIVH